MSGLVTGTQQPEDSASHFNAMRYVAQMMDGKNAKMFPAEVIAVTNNGGVAPTGTVDVKPLMPQLDASGNAVPISPIYGLTYFRMCATAGWAIIADPAIGDNGWVVVADGDISSVKSNRGPANPGSFRKSNESDGVFFGGGLDQTPTQSIALSAAGLNISTHGNITWSAANTTLDASGNLAVIGEMTRGKGTGDQVDLGQHQHNVQNVQGGMSTIETTPPIAGT